MKPIPLQALVFDVDGTLADTERAHRAAFNHAFSEAGLDWHWDEPLYTRLLDVSGGKERILHYWKTIRGGVLDVSGSGVADTVQRLHDLKTAAYEAMVGSGAVSLRPGVLELIGQARAQGIGVAIATTTSPLNIAALLRRGMGADWRPNFSVIADASTAPVKKPHPQVYLQALDAMNLPAAACLAFEDSANGLRAATGAGLCTIVTPTRFTGHHDFSGALRVLLDLRGVGIDSLQEWRAAQRAGAAASVAGSAVFGAPDPDGSYRGVAGRLREQAAANLD